MATTITKSISVTDSCIKQTGSTAKRCSAVVLGDTTYVDSYTTEGTTSGSACCSSTTELCMNAWVGCPIVFGSVSWKSTITIDGETYALKSSTGTGSSTSTATYELTSKAKLNAPGLSDGFDDDSPTYGSYSVVITNPNRVAAYPFYNGTSHDILSPGGSTTVTFSYGSATSDTFSCFLAPSDTTNYESSDTNDITITRRYKLTVNWYRAYTKFNTGTTPVKYGETVNVSDYTLDGMAGTGWEFNYSSPSSDFTMDGDRELNAYYKSSSSYDTLDKPTIAVYGTKTYDSLKIKFTNGNSIAVACYYLLDPTSKPTSANDIINNSHYTTTIDANATSLPEDIGWDDGATGTDVYACFVPQSSSSSYLNSAVAHLYIARPEQTITSISDPVLSIDSEDTNNFDLKVVNNNSVAVSWYWGYTSNPTTYVGTIAKNGDYDILNITKTTNKTIYVKFVYGNLTSSNSISVPYIKETTQLTKPVVTLNSEKTTNAAYYYTIRNNNNTSVAVYINGVKQSANLNGNTENEYSGSWASGATSITITSYFGTLSSEYTNSETSEPLTIERPKIKLPQPQLTIVSNTYSSYKFNYMNKSVLYSVQPFFNGSSQGDVLGPSQDRDYSFDWGTGETSKTIYAYAMPTDSTQYSSSDRVEFSITRPKILSIPEVTNVEQGATSAVLTIKNNNEVSVLCYVNNSALTGGISGNSTTTYTYTWESGETSKTFSIKFTDPTGQYGASNALEKTISKETPTLLDPTLSSVVSLTGYSITISNTNSVTVTYLIDNVEQGTINSSESATYNGTWGASETSKTIAVKFTATNYESSSKSIKVDKPGVISVSAPNLVLTENTIKSYKITISNTNTRVGTYYLVDSAHEKIDNITLAQGESYDYTKDWQEGETSKSFSCALLLIVENEVDTDDPTYIYSETATLDTFNKPINALEKPILSEGTTSYETSSITIKNPNDIAVTYLVNNAQQSTTISSNATATYTYTWLDGEKSKRFDVQFTAENYDPSETYIEITRPKKLVEPIVELLVNNHNDYAIRIKNKNNEIVSLFEETAGDLSKTISAKGQVIIKGTWASTETTKTLKYYFKATGYGQSTGVSLTFERLNDDDYYVLYLNIDGTVYQVGKKYELQVANATTLGGVKLGYTNTGRNYKLQVDVNGNAYINVPWTDTTYTLPTASATLKGGVKVSGNDGLQMDGETLKAKIDNSSIQIGTSGLETKVDGITIQKSANGLVSKQVAVTVNDTTKDILIEIK